MWIGQLGSTAIAMNGVVLPRYPVGHLREPTQSDVELARSAMRVRRRITRPEGPSPPTGYSSAATAFWRLPQFAG